MSNFWSRKVGPILGPRKCIANGLLVQNRLRRIWTKGNIRTISKWTKTALWQVMIDFGEKRLYFSPKFMITCQIAVLVHF